MKRVVGLGLVLGVIAAVLGMPHRLHASASASTAEQFYQRILGDWVGTSVSRFDDEEPTTNYFHVKITRSSPRTFREEYVYWRRNPDTGVLEPSGTQTNTATIEPDGTVRCVSSGRGTILIDYKPRKKQWQAKGSGACVAPDQFCAEVSGTVSVEGMPFGLGRKGRIQKGVASWSLRDGHLIGRTEVDSRFRAVVFTKRFRLVTELRAERGSDVHALAARTPAPTAAAHRPLGRS